MHVRATKSRMLGGAGVALIALILGGCASSAPNALMRTQISEARASVARAIDAGAMEHAPILIRDAEDKIVEAEAVHRRRGGEISRQLLEAARVDAELAEQTARAAKAKTTANEIRESIRTIQEETTRGRSQ